MKMDNTDYKSRRDFIKLKADVLNKASVDSVLDLIHKLHNKEIKQKVKRYEEQVQEFVKKESPNLYKSYESIMLEQFELFAKKQLDYGISNISTVLT